MQNKLILLISLMVSISANAAPVVVSANSSAPVSTTPIKPVVANTVNNSLNVSTPAVQQADNDYNRLNALKRQAEIKEQENKLNPAIVSSGGGGKSLGISETTATGIVVDQNGKSLAILQFLDGSTLLVSPGDKIGKYTVQKITLAGVSIAQCKNKCSKSILIKRAYPIMPGGSNGLGNNISSPIQSTSIFNQSSSDSTVPPIGTFK